ncbi:MAG: NAD(P)-dependent glycerol-1-phosphate dehydrogenase [Candidatus Wukongarchaeota archaeon]|nr:NAD(P)-dependent glycerol-1-phosphate dehydrogenase [Candidatus Wukongarchaeota archaeon]
MIQKKQVFRLHRIELPRQIVVGEGVISLTGEISKELGFSDSAAIVTGPNVVKVARIVEESLQEASFNVSMVEGTSATLEEAERVREFIHETKPEIVMGVGGGKSVDLAKYAATKENLFFFSIPTAASHDGISSPFCSIKGENTRHSVIAKTPLAIIGDTEIIAKAPRKLLASGCADLVAKLTAVKDWQLAHRLKNEALSESAASLALLASQMIFDEADTIKVNAVESARTVLKALISSGVAICIAGSSRPASGSEHLFSHALDIIAPKPALHGEQCGVGTIMMEFLHGGDWKRVKETLRKVGAPTTAKELGINPEHIIEALKIAHTLRPERYTILGKEGLTHEAAVKLATITGVI